MDIRFRLGYICFIWNDETFLGGAFVLVCLETYLNIELQKDLLYFEKKSWHLQLIWSFCLK